MEELHQEKVKQMIKSAEGCAGRLQKNHEARCSMVRRCTDLEKRKKKMQGCWNVVKQREKVGRALAV